MPRKKQNSDEETDEEILRHRNVPVGLAAKYIGWSTCTLYYALQDGRAPFGFASCHENNEGKTVWTYNISPKLLTAYKEGTFMCMGLKDVVKMLSDEIEALLGGDRFTKIILRGFMSTMDRLEGGIS